nr:MAG TPA: hypothetical protein [Caudoviricetes sp.]
MMEETIFNKRWIKLDMLISRLERKRQAGVKYLPQTVFLDELLSLENETKFEELLEEKCKEDPRLTESLEDFKNRFTGAYQYQPDNDEDSILNRIDFLEYLRTK